MKNLRMNSKENFLAKIFWRTINILAFIILFSAHSLAEQRNIGSQQYNNGVYIKGVNVPVSTEPNKGVVRDRLELDTGKNSSIYKDAQYKRMERRRVLNEIFDPRILMNPIIRTIRPIDHIGISPAYITQIIFPEEMVITDTVASFETKIFEGNRNILRLRPDANTFFAGNIVINMSDGSKNYTMSIFVERYYNDECREDAEERSYVCRKRMSIGLDNNSKYKYTYNNLSTVYQYTNPHAVDNMEVIALYERMMGKTLSIKRNGLSVGLRYDGIEYTITRDDRYGSYEGGIMYRGIGYRVYNSTESDGEL